MTDTTNSGAPAADQSDQTAAAAQDMQQEQQAPVTQEVEQEKLYDAFRAIGESGDPLAAMESASRTLSGMIAQQSPKTVVQIAHATKSLVSQAYLLQETLMQIAQQMISGISEINLDEITRYIEERKKYIGELQPYIEKELEQLHTEHPETAEITLDDIAGSFDLAGCFDDSELEELQREFENDPTIAPTMETDPVLKYMVLVFGAVAEAQRKCAADKGKEPEQRTQIQKSDITEMIYPLDKVNSALWGLIERGIRQPLKAESDKDNKRGKQANIYVILDFEEIPGISISRKLGMYDKRVFIATANLAKQGHKIVTVSQIYKQMGNRGRPSAADREKILKSLEFMAIVRVYLDNTEEAKLYTKYERVKGNFYLLATQSIQGCELNGMPVDDAIQIMEYPFVFDFAERRGQVTTAPIELLESPISKTEANLLLEDYLFTRIARMRNNKGISRTIRLATIYDNCQITTKMQKSRLPEKIKRILNHYKETKWIKGYILTEQSIEIMTYKS